MILSNACFGLCWFEEKCVSAERLCLISTFFILNVCSATFTKATTKLQDFLEFDPYYSRDTLPLNTYPAKAPHTGKIVSVKRIVGPDATGETCDIIIDHAGKMPYIEGQSYGVIPPGTNPKNGKPFTNRLYSIASTRYGDDMKVRTSLGKRIYACRELFAFLEINTDKLVC
jgi:sulfite reductase alpha subunit-like flavoprotein